MRILVIEDEFKIADSIKDYLELQGDEVEFVTNGAVGLERAGQGVYDALILDLMLPDMDGMTILKTLRREGNRVPILILSAKNHIEDKVQGLQDGAQDYMTKPFDLRELYLRLRVLAGKQIAVENRKFGNQFLDLELPEGEYLLRNAEKNTEIRLSAKEYRLMELFMKNQKQILSKEQLEERIWGYDSEVAYNNIEVYISFLRKKFRYLETRAEIATLRGIGYQLREGKKHEADQA